MKRIIVVAVIITKTLGAMSRSIFSSEKKRISLYRKPSIRQKIARGINHAKYKEILRLFR